VQPGEFCEPTLNQCLPQSPPIDCEVVPVITSFDATVEWSWSSDQSATTPVVGDVDGDGVQEVVVNVFFLPVGPGDSRTGELIILDGQTGQLEHRIQESPPTEYGSNGRSGVAIGDVSGDGQPDIVYVGRPNNSTDDLSRLVAIDGDGNLLWRSTAVGGAPYTFEVDTGSPTLANFDDDDAAEIVMGAALLDDDGTVLWDATAPGNPGGGSLYGSNTTYTGSLAVVADLDDDGAPEIITGRRAYSVSWPAGGSPTVSLFWDAGGDDGYPAVLDIEGDGDPEVVLIANGTLRALNGQTGQAWCGVDPTDATCLSQPSLRTPAIALPGTGRGGPPTVADFDGDGRPEVGAAGGTAYTVFDFYRSGETVVQPGGFPVAVLGEMFVRWTQGTVDSTSNATGSSVFDFEGDGIAEVVYNDECNVRVYDGRDGSTLLTIPNSTATLHEYPIVADVDSDGNAEILMVANADFHTDTLFMSDPNHCGTSYTGLRGGVFVYGDTNDQWVPTRQLWTQHTYHVTNATSAGNVPAVEADNWTTSGLNNYRQNAQGAGVFNAADLTVSAGVSLSLCGSAIELLATVRNEGSLGAPAGITVTFYQGTDNTGTQIGSVVTTVPLLPGESETVSLLQTAPAAITDYYIEINATGAVIVPECDTTNNGDGTLGYCPMAG
jgi:hypothetical protein